MRILLVTPPHTPPEKPYVATANLTGFLRDHGYDSQQFDVGIELVNRLFSRRGLERIRDEIGGKRAAGAAPGSDGAYFLENFEQYAACIETATALLKGLDMSFADRMARDDYFPKPPGTMRQWAYENAHTSAALSGLIEKQQLFSITFGSIGEIADPLAFWFGKHAIYDRARYRASLFLESISILIRAEIDPTYDLRGYAQILGEHALTFDPFEKALEHSSTLIERMIDEIAGEAVRRYGPDVLGITIPFSGSAYGAFRVARAAKLAKPGLVIAMGGGYVNCRLRKLSDARAFRYVDYVCLDDGERPLLSLLEHLEGKRSETDSSGHSRSLLTEFS